MASRRAAALTLGAAQRGVFWQVACRSGCKNACCVAVPLARAYAAAAGGDSLAKVHPPQQSMRTAYKDTDMSHTEKWMQKPGKSPIDWIAEVRPIEVSGSHIAKCYGGEDSRLGHPVEYIVLNDTSADFPAVCKYCGLRYFQGHHH